MVTREDVEAAFLNASYAEGVPAALNLNSPASSGSPAAWGRLGWQLAWVALAQAFSTLVCRASLRRVCRGGGS